MNPPEAHNVGMHMCQCYRCAKYRLVYALVVALNKDDITEQDFELGTLVLTTMLGAEDL